MALFPLCVPSLTSSHPRFSTRRRPRCVSDSCITTETAASFYSSSSSSSSSPLHFCPSWNLEVDNESIIFSDGFRGIFFSSFFLTFSSSFYPLVSILRVYLVPLSLAHLCALCCTPFVGSLLEGPELGLKTQSAVGIWRSFPFSSLFFIIIIIKMYFSVFFEREGGWPCCAAISCRPSSWQNCKDT